MREALSRALQSGHLEWEVYECPIERVAALRASTSLGSALFRWRYNGDKASRGKAYVLTLRLASRKLRIAPRHPAFDTLKLCVKQALTEWHSPNCRDCNGIGMIKTSRQQVMGEARVDHVCPTCNGSGVHTYRDFERAAALNVRRLDQWTERLERIRQMVSAREIGVMVGARRELER